MPTERTGSPVYVALVLAVAAAVLSFVPPGQPYAQARLLLITVGSAQAEAEPGGIRADDTSTTAIPP
jgi:hypothetical protein